MSSDPCGGFECTRIPGQHWEVWKPWGGKAAQARDRPSRARRQHQKVLGCLGWPGHPTLLPSVQRNGLRNQGTETALQSWLRHTCWFLLKCKGNTVPQCSVGCMDHLYIRGCVRPFVVAYIYREQGLESSALLSGDTSLLWGAVLCTGGYLAASLASTH